MSEWISVNDKYPDNLQFVKIKILDSKNDCECEAEAIFNDNEDYRSWTIKEHFFEGRTLIARPTHWMPLPKGPKDE